MTTICYLIIFWGIFKNVFVKSLKFNSFCVELLHFVILSAKASKVQTLSNVFTFKSAFSCFTVLRVFELQNNSIFDKGFWILRLFCSPNIARVPTWSDRCLHKSIRWLIITFYQFYNPLYYKKIISIVVVFLFYYLALFNLPHDEVMTLHILNMFLFHSKSPSKRNKKTIVATKAMFSCAI